MLLLHGHGDRPDTFVDIGTALVEGTDWTLRCPPAPHALGQDELGLAWWLADEEGPSEATLAGLTALLSPPDGPSHASVAVVGFSQGAATGLALAAALGARPAGPPLRVAVIAGFLPGNGVVAPPGSDVLVVHGEADDVVDPFHGELVARRCRRQGCTVQELHHPGGHQWDGWVSAAVRSWLLR